MKAGQAQIVAHCDDPPCDLGCFEYVCPACEKRHSDYEDLWWNKDSLYEGGVHRFKCGGCKTHLVAYFDREETEYRVRRATVIDFVPDEPHKGEDAEIFTMTVVLLPGEKPQLFTTPRYCKKAEWPDDVARDEFFKKLIGVGVVQACDDTAKHLLNHYLGPEAERASTKELRRLAEEKRKEEEAEKLRLYNRDELWTLIKGTQYGTLNTGNDRIYASYLALTDPDMRKIAVATVPEARKERIVALLKHNGVEI
jgi:hypothetical protein